MYENCEHFPSPSGSRITTRTTCTSSDTLTKSVTWKASTTVPCPGKAFLLLGITVRWTMQRFNRYTIHLTTIAVVRRDNRQLPTVAPSSVFSRIPESCDRWVSSRFLYIRVFLVYVVMCVLEIHQWSARGKLRYVSRTLDTYKPCLMERLWPWHYYYHEDDEKSHI